MNIRPRLPHGDPVIREHAPRMLGIWTGLAAPHDRWNWQGIYITRQALGVQHLHHARLSLAQNDLAQTITGAESLHR
jgi:hypothetical protein